MPRIAIAGFQHETNSFSATRANLPEFEMADSWPPLLSGGQVIPGTRGMNLPIAGFAAAATGRADLVPLLWCAAEPSGPVTDHAFETITARLLDGLAHAGRIDGLYLDLHGAMISNSHDDGEGELLTRLRTALGPDLPIAISLDMHANLTETIVRHATSIAMFRTYPHLDMAATGARCVNQILYQISGYRPARAIRQVPYLIPLHAQFTGAEPAQSIYREVAATTHDPQSWTEFAVGFSAGDTPHTGASILAHAPTQARADVLADDLFEKILDAEHAFAHPLPDAAEAVARAMGAPRGKPVVIADVQDNPGGGGSSDTTGLLRALVDAGASGVILGILHDASAAALAHAAGIGAEIATALGGRSGIDGDAPFDGRFRVTALSDGDVPYEDEMYLGGIARIGPTAVLRLLDPRAEVDILVSSVRNQCLDRAFFRHVGLVPETARILCVKSTVHFRAAFEPIAQMVLSARAPGALACDLSRVDYTRLRPGLRLGPNGSVFCP